MGLELCYDTLFFGGSDTAESSTRKRCSHCDQPTIDPLLSWCRYHAPGPVCCTHKHCPELAELPSSLCSIHQRAFAKFPKAELEGEITRICAAMPQLPARVCAKAKEVLTTYAQTNTQKCWRLKDRHQLYACGAIYAACKVCAVPLAIHEINRHLPSASAGHFTKAFNRFCSDILDSFPARPQSLGPTEFLARYVAELGLPEHSIIIMQEVLAKLKADVSVWHRRPERVAAGVILLCCKEHRWLDSDGNRVSPAKISEVVQVPLQNLNDWAEQYLRPNLLQPDDSDDDL